MSRFRVIAVDDEPLALELVEDLLKRDPEVRFLGGCGDGKAAIELILRSGPDIVFLDIEMPEEGGLDVVRAIPQEELPAVVFVTAYGHHAIKAFEVEALDYVVKPFSDDRFFFALERAKRRVRERRLGELAGKMASLTAELEHGSGGEGPPREDPGYLTRISVTTKGRSIIVRSREIQWIESCDYYSRLHVAQSSYLVRVSLNSFEERLDPAHFVRVHRGSIVNIDSVAEIQHLSRGTRRIVLSDGTQLPISRSRLGRVDQVFAPRMGR